MCFNWWVFTLRETNVFVNCDTLLGDKFVERMKNINEAPYNTKTWDVKKKSKKGRWSNEMLSQFKNQYKIYNSINLFFLDLKCSNMH
jgi:hypothetical protein